MLSLAVSSRLATCLLVFRSGQLRVWGLREELVQHFQQTAVSCGTVLVQTNGQRCCAVRLAARMLHRYGEWLCVLHVNRLTSLLLLLLRGFLCSSGMPFSP